MDSQALTTLAAEFLTNELNSALAQEVEPTKKGSLALVLDGKSLRCALLHAQLVSPDYQGRTRRNVLGLTSLPRGESQRGQ